MKRITDFFEQGTIIPAALVASAIIGLIAIFGLSVVPGVGEPVAEIRIEPSEQTVQAGDTFTIKLVAESRIPVNVFAGDLTFDYTVLEIDSIDYNTTIADLWAELPWYSNGDGTLTFTGGSTRPGGFMGDGELITVTFKALREGDGNIMLEEARILQHDGLGTDAQLSEPIDTLFRVEGDTSSTTIIAQSSQSTSVTIVPEPPSTDLNGDGKQSIADISIFMLNLISYDARYDFNLDQKVDTRDLNLLLSAE